MDGDVFGNAAWRFLNGKPIAFFFCPDKGLVPVNPRAAQFNSASFVFDGVCASAKAITCLDNDGTDPSLFEIAGSCNACQATTNNNNLPLY